MSADGILWLSCGVLKAELEALAGSGYLKGEILCLESMLHMNPPALGRLLARHLAGRQEPLRRVVLVYGDCCPDMVDLEALPGVSRVAASNCAHMVLGTPRYRELMRQGVFCLLPEWTPRWERVFRNELGLDEILAPQVMGQERSGLVYLDTGLVPVPEALLQDCAAFVGLGWRVEPVGLGALNACLQEVGTRI